jgi:PAS domain S-box-containing protein
MTFSSAPIFAVDVVGSILMIILSFACIGMVRRLKAHDPENVIWTYLLWFCCGLTGFSISRSAGHILKQFLYLADLQALWRPMRPFSGAINTMMFILVASVTLFFERVWGIYQQVVRDRQALQTTHNELLYLNQNLESLVVERTEELVSSERRYRRIFELSKDMILVADSKGQIVELNPAGYQMLNEDRRTGTIEGRGFGNYFTRQADWQQITATIDRQGFISSEETDLTPRDGNPKRVLLSAARHESLHERQPTIHFLVKDIERQRLMKDQIAQADKLASIGQLSSGVAHEINNPLGIIQGYTQLLLRAQGRDSDHYNDLKTIEKHVRHCKSIVENLLKFARPSETKRQPVQINEMVDEVLDFTGYDHDFSRLSLTTAYDDRLPTVMADEKKLRQVVMNLIMNAHHAVAHGKAGAIYITTARQTKNEVCISVSDNGHGIEKKNLLKIFDPFFTTKPPGEGTGLGLSVSYGIIKSHGGNIRVESTPGKGTTFTVTLPVHASPVEESL